METNEKIEHINKPIKCLTMVFEPLSFYIAHVHIITVASLPTEPPRHDHYLSLNPYNCFTCSVITFFLNELE